MSPLLISRIPLLRPLAEYFTGKASRNPESRVGLFSSMVFWGTDEGLLVVSREYRTIIPIQAPYDTVPYSLPIPTRLFQKHGTSGYWIKLSFSNETPNADHEHHSVRQLSHLGKHGLGVIGRGRGGEIYSMIDTGA